MNKRVIAQVAIISVFVLLSTSSANIAFAKENQSSWWGSRVWTSFVQKFEHKEVKKEKEESKKEERREEKSEKHEGKGHDKDDRGNHGKPTTTPDTTAPVISNIAVVGISTSSAAVNWNTNEKASGKVYYSDGAVLRNKNGASGVTAQSVPLSALTASTTYDYVVVATDAAGNTATSSSRSFTTLPLPIVVPPPPPPPPADITAPTFELLISGNIGTSTAQVNWKTSEVAQSDLYFTDGITPQVRIASATSIFGFEQLKSLTPSTTYSYFVVAKDAAGNTGTSTTRTFTTLALPVVPPPPPQPTSIDFGITLPSTGNWDIQSDVVMWQNTLHVGPTTTRIDYINFSASGTAPVNAIVNFRLLVDGVQRGLASSSLSATKTVSFVPNMTLSPGSHTLQLLGDIVGGGGTSIAFSVLTVSDVQIYDSLSSGYLASTVFGGSFLPLTAGTITINTAPPQAPMVTITKSTSSPAGNIPLRGLNVPLAKYDIGSATGTLQVHNLNFGFTTSNPGVTSLVGLVILINGTFYSAPSPIPLNGISVGFGNSLIVPAGSTSTIEIRGHVRESTGVSLSDGDTITVQIKPTNNSFSWVNMPSLVGSLPNYVNGNTLSLKKSQVALLKYPGYNNQTVVTPQTTYKISEFRLSASGAEDIILRSGTLQLSGVFPFSSTTDIFLVYGGTTTAPQDWSPIMNFSLGSSTLPLGETIPVAIYANLPPNTPSGAFFTPNLSVSYAGKYVTLPALTPTEGGQTITAGNGKLTATTDPSTPVSRLVVGNTMPKIASYKFTALNEAFTITELTATTTDPSAIIELVFKDGATELGRQTFDGNVATKTGLSIPISYNSNKVIDIYANLGSIGTGAGNSGANVGVALVSYKYQNSGGTNLDSGSIISLVGYPSYAYKTKPTITNVALPTTILTFGTQTIAQFSVTADAGGAISWEKIKLNVSKSQNVGYSSVAIYDAANQSVPLIGVTVSTTSSSITLTSTQDQEVVGSKTYVVKATIIGILQPGDTFSTSIGSSGLGYAAPTAATLAAATPATFVWSDESITGHSLTTNDWNTDFLVKNLPTDSQVLTK